MEEIVWYSKYHNLEIDSSLSNGQSRKSRSEAIRSYLQEKKVSKDLAKDRNTWKSFIRNCPIHANMKIKQDEE